MSECAHCATPFSASEENERFCCKGCEFVHELIHDGGFERYYELRGGVPSTPVRSVPFESHDFTWLLERITAIESASPGASAVEADFSLDGISCIGCVWLVEKLFLRQPGALEAAAHPATGRVHLRWLRGQTDLAAFAGELVSFGYTLAPRRDGNSASEAGKLGARLGLCGAFMLNAMGFTLPVYLGMPDSFAFSGLFELIALLSATLSMLAGGSYFITRAWKSARMGMPHIDLPIGLGLVVAYAGSIVGWIGGIQGLVYFDFVSTFVFLMLGGRYLQLSAMEKNRRRLQRHRPVPESMVSPDHEHPVTLADLTPGVRFRLEPGQASPVAAVPASEAEFSLEWINGEAESVSFRPGRQLPAGSILLTGSPVLLTASETWKESLLAKLVDSERPLVRVPALERLLKYYLLAVLLVGTGGFFFWNSRHGFPQALQVMISVFVVSCPCALGVSLPMADEIAGSIMERMGVFIRQPLLWSRLRRIRTVIFDKTGTLTLERPVLANPGVLATLGTEERLALARLSNGSLHPVSRSLLESLGREGQELLRLHPDVEVTDVPGTGRIYGDWMLGKPAVGSEHDVELSRKGEVVARFVFRESLRADAIACFARLRAMGLRLVILSGDRPEKVAEAARVLNIPTRDAHASQLPSDKAEVVAGLDRQDTLFLGDGANDSLAFNAAWTTGTPVVDRSLLEEKADFFFLGRGLGFLPQLLALARKRQRVVRMAFSFSIAYNACAIVVCLTGHMSPLLAAILMPLSSALSLAIVGLGLGRHRKAVTGMNSFRDGGGAKNPAMGDVPEETRLRPRVA